MRARNGIQAEHWSGSDSKFLVLTYQCLGKQKHVSPGKVPYGPSCQLLELVRQLEGTVLHKNKTAVQMVYAVNGLKTNLLGLLTITALFLATRVDNTSKTRFNAQEEFASVFQGLGENYNIKLIPESEMQNQYVSCSMAVTECHYTCIMCE